MQILDVDKTRERKAKSYKNGQPLKNTVTNTVEVAL